MIPVLYEANIKAFTNNGIGCLTDAISCNVEESRNGAFELTMTYPQSGEMYKELRLSRIIVAVPGDGRNRQGFRIYKITKPINGIVTIYAEHISYQLSSIPCSRFKASSAAEALTGLKNNAATECPFTFWTDITISGNFSVDEPVSIRSKLGGSEGSILDIYGGEWEWDNYDVKLRSRRGQDQGVVLHYGKNIQDLKQEENITNTITGVYPFWRGMEENGPFVELDQKVVLAENAANYPYPRITVIDCTDEFENQPTNAELYEWAKKYVKKEGIGIPAVSISVSFIALWQTEEYKNIAPLERVGLCDTVTIEYEDLGVSAKAKVIKTDYNVLLDRYNKIEIGEAKSSLVSTIVNQKKEINEKPSSGFLQAAVENATNWITGANGGYVIMNKNGNNQPYEILIMDTDNIQTATKVWRWNQGGLGYSSNGYNGPYATAITQDGKIVADFITAGKMMANMIQGGILTLGGKDNGNGCCVIRDASGAEIGRLNNEGIKFIKGSINLGSLFSADSSGNVTANSLKSSNAQITGGTINIDTSSDDISVITLRSGDTWNQIAPSSVLMQWDMEGTEENAFIHPGGISAKNNRGYFIYDGLMCIIESEIMISFTTEKFVVDGTKNRVIKTKDFGKILQYCYEMPSPMFGDIGTGKTDSSGYAYIYFDQIFHQTVTSEMIYYVFLQKESQGDLWVDEKTSEFFLIKGTPNLPFSWEVKVRQKDYEYERLETMDESERKRDIDYGARAKAYLNEYEKEILDYEKNN